MHPNRIGRFTSSPVAALFSKNKQGIVGAGKAAIDYIEEKNFERRLGLPLQEEVFSKPTSWGHLHELFVFQNLPMSYSIHSNETIIHPYFDFWAGSPDTTKHGKKATTGDIKSPFTRKSFCQLVKAVYELGLTGIAAIMWIRENHPFGEYYYWQLVSNACIKGHDFAELIVTIPYESEIEHVQELASQYEEYAWISRAGKNELPWIKDNGFYKNRTHIKFEVPVDDKTLLTNAILDASYKLVKYF